MEFDGAVIKERDVTYAVVAVKGGVIDSDNTLAAEQAVNSYQKYFPSLPVVLIAQDLTGSPTYYGDKDIVTLLARLPFNQIPWKRYGA
ncbi:hypothetical protein [Anaeroselena agilis]|uniref:Uncharacterized protein n=1 Tax=Anaeroselena agilis TaxID=3063788 RepID=A0ABU3NXS6_9FIRM|nr:hypothetical protein [Selenomonadales bacterium 4137-cl]